MHLPIVSCLEVILLMLQTYHAFVTERVLREVFLFIFSKCYKETCRKFYNTKHESIFVTLLNRI